MLVLLYSPLDQFECLVCGALTLDLCTCLNLDINSEIAVASTINFEEIIAGNSNNLSKFGKNVNQTAFLNYIEHVDYMPILTKYEVNLGYLQPRNKSLLPHLFENCQIDNYNHISYEAQKPTSDIVIYIFGLFNELNLLRLLILIGIKLQVMHWSFCYYFFFSPLLYIYCCEYAFLFVNETGHSLTPELLNTKIHSEINTVVENYKKLIQNDIELNSKDNLKAIDVLLQNQIKFIIFKNEGAENFVCYLDFFQKKDLTTQEVVNILNGHKKDLLLKENRCELIRAKNFHIRSFYTVEGARLGFDYFIHYWTQIPWHGRLTDIKVSFLISADNSIIFNIGYFDKMVKICPWFNLNGLTQVIFIFFLLSFFLLRLCLVLIYSILFYLNIKNLILLIKG